MFPIPTSLCEYLFQVTSFGCFPEGKCVIINLGNRLAAGPAPGAMGPDAGHSHGALTLPLGSPLAKKCAISAAHKAGFLEMFGGNMMVSLSTTPRKPILGRSEAGIREAAPGHATLLTPLSYSPQRFHLQQ